MPNFREKKTFDGPGTLPKALSLLTAIGSYPRGARFTDLSKDTKLPIATAHRVLAMLVEYGFVDYREDERLYTLGLRIFELSHNVAAVNSFSETALPIMKELARTSGNMVLLNVFAEDHTLVIERAEPEHAVQVRTNIGARLPLHSTASGKAILASLPEDERSALIKSLNLYRVTRNTVTRRSDLKKEVEAVSKKGFGYVNEENEQGIRSVAVVISSSKSQQRAALSMAAPCFLVSEKAMLSQVHLLKSASADIAARLIGYRS